MTGARAAARLDTGDSQAVYRVLLDTLSRPGTIGHLGAVLPDWPLPYPLLVPLALSDVDVAVAVVGDHHDTWEDLVAGATGARTAEPADADVVVALRAPAARTCWPCAAAARSLRSWAHGWRWPATRWARPARP